MNAVSELQVLDNVLADPVEYRRAALRADFKSYDFGHCVFHGLGTPVEPPTELLAVIREHHPDLTPTLSLYRRSPLNQVEPHDIHTDVDLGEWTGILYLNPQPPPEDGTLFWTHRATGAIQSLIPHERSKEGMDRRNWILREVIESRFNRLLLFPSAFFHSRAIFENWGAGEDGRLIQIVFGKGAL